jgi:hypothetical protein
MGQSIIPSAGRRLTRAVSAALLGMAVTAGSVGANEPSDWVLPEDDSAVRIPALVPAPLADRPVVIPAAGPSSSPEATATPTSSPSPTPSASSEPGSDRTGYDISYPQCGDDYPDQFAFAVVGVNGGRVFDRNPCLGPGDEASQLEWAGPEAELYFNTGNPGPRTSRYWPRGQDAPRLCDARSGRGEDDTADCAFVYGWNTAEFAYASALQAFIDLGWAEDDAERLPGETTIWLDVEPANSWRRDRSLNVATLDGAVAYLESMEVERIGFYSTPRLWDRITGGTDRFEDYPAWHAGARDREDAERRCEEERAFTGGELAMVQWVENGLDHNIRCEAGEPAS